jgi:hypothetical protein
MSRNPNTDPPEPSEQPTGEPPPVEPGDPVLPDPSQPPVPLPPGTEPTPPAPVREPEEAPAPVGDPPPSDPTYRLAQTPALIQGYDRSSSVLTIG